MGRRNTTRRGPLPNPAIHADDSTLTSFSGIVPLIRFIEEKLDIGQALLRVAPRDGFRRVYARHLVLFAFMVAALVGEHRLAHVEALRGDAVLLKFLRLPGWPVRKVFSSALAQISDAGIAALHELIARVGLQPLAGRSHAVIDLDSSAVVAFGRQEGTRFGYSGKGRNRRRHHPLVASIAEIRTVVRAVYRDGSGITSEETIAFLKTVFATVRRHIGEGVALKFRADSGFWSHAVGAWLLEQNVPFIFALPLHCGVKLMLRRTRWRGLDGDKDIQVATLRGPRVGLDERLRVVAVRRRVLDPKAPPQGKRIDGCTHWRYQALVTSMDGVPEELWRFYNGRADCERVFRTARQALGMGKLVGQIFRANEAAFMLRLLAMNADLRFQADREARAERAPDAKSAPRQGLIRRQRSFYRTPGRLLKSQGRWRLRVPDRPSLAELWRHYAPGRVALE